MSTLKTSVNYKNLEDELRAALAADELYKLQNDAKIRAVEQGTPTYEHFRQMVNGAHLKPLDRDDMKPKFGVQWNPMINNIQHSISSTCSEKPKGDKEDKRKIIQKKLPDTCESFLQTWRTITNCIERFTYVWNQRNILQSHIFRIELPTSFLSDFIDTCLQYLSNTDDVTSIIEVFGILSKCNRFNLTICFMTKNEKFICEKCFQQLQIKGGLQDKLLEDIIKSLAGRYEIKLSWH